MAAGRSRSQVCDERNCLTLSTLPIFPSGSFHMVVYQLGIVLASLRLLGSQKQSLIFKRINLAGQDWGGIVACCMLGLKRRILLNHSKKFYILVLSTMSIIPLGCKSLQKPSVDHVQAIV